MSDPDSALQGPTSGVTPHLTIPSRGGEAAVEFYARVFGAQVLDRKYAEDGERLIHAHLRINGASIMLHDEFPEYGHSADVVPAGCVFHLQVDDADAWWERAMLGARSRPCRSRTSSGAIATASSRIRSVTTGRSDRRSRLSGRCP